MVDVDNSWWRRQGRESEWLLQPISILAHTTPALEIVASKTQAVPMSKNLTSNNCKHSMNDYYIYWIDHHQFNLMNELVVQTSPPQVKVS